MVCACNCDNNNQLYKVCPEPHACTIDADNKIIIYEDDMTSPMVVGECSNGITKCNDKGEVALCAGFVPPTTEVCDGKDNNCDGTRDEGFDQDRDGFTTCQNDCNDNDRTINPSVLETCNNIDDNCDTVIDEDLSQACWSGSSLSVFNDASICKKGHKECTAGVWSSCQDQVFPASHELCDGLDNNCNGQIDETVPDICGPVRAVGACRFGDQICVDNDAVCINATYPTAETCNNVDDDCNNQIDEGLSQRCETICGRGYEICSYGQWVNCDAQQPQPEVCDGIDNDCNGGVDEGCLCSNGTVQPCIGNIIDRVTGMQVTCGLGVQLCVDGAWDTCYAFGITEEACNAWDDDCDGTVDDFTKRCGDLIHDGIGQCLAGTSTCTLGSWSECSGEIVQTKEICDQLDNDCDGDIDEELNPHDKVDLVFAIDDSGSMCPIDMALIQAISQYVAEFVGTDHRFALVTFPGDSTDTFPYLVRTNPSLTDVGGFIAALNTLICSSGGSEPSYDVMRDLASTNDPVGIGWRPDAYPYIILISDENAQTWTMTTEADVAALTSNCTIGSCVAGDQVEDYIITGSAYFPEWDTIVYSETDRLIEINPADSARYVSILRNIFSNVCF